MQREPERALDTELDVQASGSGLCSSNSESTLSSALPVGNGYSPWN